MNLAAYELVVFDLDGTLAPSKSRIDEEMGGLISQLSKRVKVAVMSGGSYAQFEKQLTAYMPSDCAFSNIVLMPTSGARMFTWHGAWQQKYADELTPKEKEKILIALHAALRGASYQKPEKVYGEIIEDRGTQITFSAFGQNAPLELKEAWDPQRTKRDAIAAVLRPKIPEFDVRIGGTTSLDITRRGVNKAYGIRKLEDFFSLVPSQIFFVGDSIFKGGNDFLVKATGIDYKQVEGPEQTKQIIRDLLK